MPTMTAVVPVIAAGRRGQGQSDSVSTANEQAVGFAHVGIAFMRMGQATGRLQAGTASEAAHAEHNVRLRAARFSCL